MQLFKQRSSKGSNSQPHLQRWRVWVAQRQRVRLQYLQVLMYRIRQALVVVTLAQA
jgi:hypothetical protein